MDESIRSKLVELREEKAKNIMLEDSIKELTSQPGDALLLDESYGNRKLTNEEIKKLKTIKDSVAIINNRKEKMLSDLKKQLEE